MADIDDFATTLLEEAKRFAEKADAETNSEAANAYLHAALMLGFSALEAHVNAICVEICDRPELSTHEKGLLLEKDIRLDDGEFVLGNLRMSKMEDRILLLYRKFSGKKLDKKVAWWAQLKQATTSRNNLTHPKQSHAISLTTVREALRSIVDVIDVLYKAIYQKPFPAAGLGLDSRLNF